MLHVAVFRGPSVIAFAKMMEDSPEIEGKRLSVDIVDSPELMQEIFFTRMPCLGKSVSCRKARDTESITGNGDFICLRCRHNSRYPDPLLFTSKRIILFIELFVYYSR